MKKTQLIITAFALTALAIIFFVFKGGENKQYSSNNTNKTQKQAKPANKTTFTFTFSPEKKALLMPIIKQYNSQSNYQVKAIEMASGDAEKALAKDKLQTDVWSPASSLWGRLLNMEKDQPLTEKMNPSIVRTPLVIAMWKNQAEALGWPKKKIGWDTLTKLSTGSGWNSVGHPEFGQFKLVHTNPDYSTSGLESTVAEYYAATNKKEGLTVNDVQKARTKVKKLEQSIIHYGDTTVFIADQLVEKGNSYASAAIMEETTLLDINKRSQNKMVAIYPEEGTFYSDNPYMIMSTISPEKKAAAENFLKFITKEITAEKAGQFGFRPANLKDKPAGELAQSPELNMKQPERVLSLPEPKVLDSIRKAWSEDRRAANVMLVLDISGSMNEEGRLEQAKSGLQTFLNNVGKQDKIGLSVFNDQFKMLAPTGTDKNKLKTMVNGLVADNGTAVYDATLKTFNDMRAKQDKENINAIVILTDGEDTDSNQSLQSVVNQIKAQGDSANHVRIFTIAYSAGAQGSQEALASIAAASGGKSYTGDTENIESVYRSISSFF